MIPSQDEFLRIPVPYDGADGYSLRKRWEAWKTLSEEDKNVLWGRAGFQRAATPEELSRLWLS